MRSDSEIIQEILEGQSESFTEIVRRHRHRIFSCAYAVTGSREDAADITQEVLIKFFDNIEQFDLRRPLAPYLLKIALNRSRDCLRSVKSRMRVLGEAEEEIAEFLSEEGERPYAGIIREEKGMFLQKLLNSLPETMREVCSLFYLTERSCGEVSEILKISESSVKVNLHRARKRLLQHLKAAEGA